MQRHKDSICKLKRSSRFRFIVYWYKQHANHICMTKGEPVTLNSTRTTSTTYKSASQIIVARIPIDASQ